MNGDYTPGPGTEPQTILPSDSEGPTTQGPLTDGPNLDPTEGPPEKLCGPIVTESDVVCGLVCVGTLGVELTILCEKAGGDSWECRLYPRVGPIVGEVYDDTPVWCGGPGEGGTTG